MKIRSMLVTCTTLLLTLTLFLLSACSSSDQDKIDAKKGTHKNGTHKNSTQINSNAATSAATKQSDPVPSTKPNKTPKEDANNPRRKVKTAVIHGLALLEKNDIESFIKTYLSPLILEQVLKKINLKDFAKSIATKAKARFKATLTEAKMLTPIYNQNRDLATYKLKPPLKPLSFFKLDGYWYIK